jgi:dTDP-4-amino-4,6-dideoxygalactose transaminase
LIKDLRARANFGFSQSRESKVTATNAKLSEYHAAIGLAALDEWDAVRREWIAVAHSYNRLLQGSNRVQLQQGFGESWITSTCVLAIADAGAERVERALGTAGVETRRWWAFGAHDHPATRHFPRSLLATTETLARSTLGLPFYRDLEARAIERIVEAVHTVA